MWRPAAVAAAIAVVLGVVAFQVFGDTAASSGEYVGRTAQRLPLRLTLAGDPQKLSLDVTWSTPCRDVARTVRRDVVAVGSDGAFSWHADHVDIVDGGDGDELRQSYRLRGRRNDDGTLSGTWHADTGYYNGESRAVEHPCTSGDVAFTVRQGGGSEKPPPKTDAAGRLVVSLESTTYAVAVGDGHTWLLDAGTPARSSSASPAKLRLTPVDPRTGAVGASTPLKPAAEPSSQYFTAGEGAAWVLADPVRRRLHRIDARTGRVALTPTAPSPLAYAGSPAVLGIVAGSGGVWLLDDTGGRVVRLDGRTGRATRTITLPVPRRPGCTPDLGAVEQITTGAGDVWATASTPQDCPADGRRLSNYYRTLSQIDARTNRVIHTFALGHRYRPYQGLEAPIAASRAGVFGLSCGIFPSGDRESLCGQAKLQRFDVRGGPRTLATLPRGKIVGVAVTRDAVWVSERLGTGPGGAVYRVDRRTKRRTTVLRTTGEPSNLTAGDGGVWVVDGGERRLVRIPA
jgi:sugar lactone lactonase YvrE